MQVRSRSKYRNWKTHPLSLYNGHWESSPDCLPKSTWWPRSYHCTHALLSSPRHSDHSWGLTHAQGSSLLSSSTLPQRTITLRLPACPLHSFTSLRALITHQLNWTPRSTPSLQSPPAMYCGERTVTVCPSSSHGVVTVCLSVLFSLCIATQTFQDSLSLSSKALTLPIPLPGITWLPYSFWLDSNCSLRVHSSVSLH